MSTTMYADDSLGDEDNRVADSTTPEDIRDFVERRAVDPIVIDGVVVWNFSNHEVDMETLREDIEDFRFYRYVIPFDASGVWGYIVELLPEQIASAEVLTYSKGQERYLPMPNYSWHSDDGEDEEFRKRLEAEVPGDDEL